MQQQGEILARKPRCPTGNASVWRFAVDWRILSTRNPRKQDCSFCKWLQVEHSSWDTPVFVPGFGFQRVLNDLERLSRAMFPIWAKECLSNSISQDYLRYRWLLRYVGRVKTRWGWVANRKAAPRMSKPISGRSSLWGLLPRIAKEPGALPGSWIHGGRYKI